MRYYNIILTNADGNTITLKSLNGLPLTSLLPTGPQNPQGGLTNIAALNVEFDIAVVASDLPDKNSWFRVWGIGLQDIETAADYNGLNIAISAGMATGLPLANPAQAGLIVSGQIFQAFGNWIGRDQYIDFIIVPGGPGIGSAQLPQNYPLIWRAGQTLASALANTLSTALPQLQQDIQISPNLVLAHDEVGHYQTLGQLASDARAISKAIIGGESYPGVGMTVVGDTIRVRDGTATTPTQITILPQDIIGQPVWLGPNQINVQLVLRADIAVNDQIILPATIFTSNPQSLRGVAANVKQTLTFQGAFDVQMVRHIGNFRQSDAVSWSTTLQCVQPVSGIDAP